MREHIKNYQKKLFNTLEDKNLYSQIEKLYNEILIAWRNKKIFSFAEMAVVVEMLYTLLMILFMVQVLLLTLD